MPFSFLAKPVKPGFASVGSFDAVSPKIICKARPGFMPSLEGDRDACSSCLVDGADWGVGFGLAASDGAGFFAGGTAGGGRGGAAFVVAGGAGGAIFAMAFGLTGGLTVGLAAFISGFLSEAGGAGGITFSAIGAGGLVAVRGAGGLVAAMTGADGFCIIGFALGLFFRAVRLAGVLGSPEGRFNFILPASLGTAT